MNGITYLRALRLRHGITLMELAEAAQVTNQQVSRVELLQMPVTKELEQKYETAMESVICQRYNAVRALEQDYRTVKGYLVHGSEEQPNGL